MKPTRTQTHPKRILIRAFTLFTSAVWLAGCGGGGSESTGATAPGVSTDPAESAAPADFNAEVYRHRSWHTLSPVEEAREEHIGTSDDYEEVVDTYRYLCTDQHYSMTRTPSEFVAIDPDTSITWVGSLIQGNSHLAVGSLRELSIRDRAPINLNIDLLRGNNARTVVRP